MEVVPVSHFIQNLAKPYINLNHHGLGPRGVKAIAIALSNATITHLESEDNCILAEGALIHSLDSSFLSSIFLNISNNHLDTAGAEAIASLLLDNMSYLHALQLSGGLYAPKESHCLYTFFSLQGNYQVKKMDLSHNEFSEQGGQLLGQTLGNLIYYSHKARSSPSSPQVMQNTNAGCETTVTEQSVSERRELKEKSITGYKAENCILLKSKIESDLF
uniref:Uncharacterized protein n=1 Tax=Bubo bubo TaxID=30461 RepID=A0A8C0FMJ2_BUBBB